MIAASIIAGRALQPLEGMIEGWRNVVQTRAAYARVRAAMESFAAETPHLRLPKPCGRLTVDRILYIPPGSQGAGAQRGELRAASPGSRSPSSAPPARASRHSPALSSDACIRPPARCGSTAPSCAIGTGGSSASAPATSRRRSSCFPAPSRRMFAACADDLPDEKVYEAAMFAGVHDMITHLSNGYETVLDRNAAPLSGGQKQRIALARAFFGAPLRHCPRRAQFESRCSRRAGACGDAAKVEGATDQRRGDHAAAGSVEQDGQAARLARRKGGGAGAAKRGSAPAGSADEWQRANIPGCRQRARRSKR